MGCGGVCTRFNDGICIGACSMDAVGRENYVKILEVREAKKKELGQDGLSGKGVVLKPLNPSAYEMFDKIKPKKTEEPSVQIQPLRESDKNDFLKMKL